ncbi:helix-turn-helix domain-containing protein [Streptomyces tateyamensis]|uniref:helix-turn-helix domain-containing protein n=1 Tax=Streptomyces tateyamensis TaxID=565073 RepID=UPI0015E8D4E9|nr:helix-turn-helix transcriptional regulator [Streptomyces tateyamensis]
MSRTVLPPPVTPREHFATQLRQTREALGLTQSQLAARMGYSAVHVSAVETGRKPPTLPFAKSLDHAFDSGTKFVDLYGKIHGTSLLQGFPEYVTHEANAIALRIFQPRTIDGLLQTAEYATAWESGNVIRGEVTQEQADSRVDLLLDRQRILTGASRPTLSTIMDETCLRRPIGSPLVMVAQLRRLEELAEQPRTTIQIAPDSLGQANPLNHPLTLLTMPGRVVLGYTEGLSRGFLERDGETVARWADSYDQLRVEALSRAASLSMIRKVREDYEHAP